jgi:hypothetical protein
LNSNRKRHRCSSQGRLTEMRETTASTELHACVYKCVCVCVCVHRRAIPKKHHVFIRTYTTHMCRTQIPLEMYTRVYIPKHRELTFIFLVYIKVYSILFCVIYHLHLPCIYQGLFGSYIRKHTYETQRKHLDLSMLLNYHKKKIPKKPANKKPHLHLSMLFDYRDKGFRHFLATAPPPVLPVTIARGQQEHQGSDHGLLPPSTTPLSTICISL